MEYDISVVIVQYNPSWDKLIKTIKSALNQKNCKYEIVVADDGSKCDYFERLRLFFQENEFFDYKLVKNQENQGTVKNVLSGLMSATGEYVRVIAPGDYIYSVDSLHRIVSFMKENMAKEVFGKLAGYQLVDEQITCVNFKAPVRTEVYKKWRNNKKIIKSLLVYGDNISGAAYSWDREYYISCLERIEDKVIFLEDCVNVYTVLENNRIYFMDEFVTWYEHGTGVSTSSSDKWLKLLSKDWDEFFNVLQSEYENVHEIKRGRLLRRLASKKNVLFRVILIILFFDRFLYFRIGKIKDLFKKDSLADIHKFFEVLM